MDNDRRYNRQDRLVAPVILAVIIIDALIALMAATVF